MRMRRIDSAGIEVWLDAHGLSMRRRREIIGRVGRRNIRRGIRGMREVKSAGALDRGWEMALAIVLPWKEPKMPDRDWAGFV